MIRDVLRPPVTALLVFAAVAAWQAVVSVEGALTCCTGSNMVRRLEWEEALATIPLVSNQEQGSGGYILSGRGVPTIGARRSGGGGSSGAGTSAIVTGTMSSSSVDDSGGLAVKAWEAYQAACGLRDIDLRLAVGVHFYLYAKPVPDGSYHPDPCVPLMLHADSSGSFGKVKEVFPTEVTDLPGSLSLGTFRFQEIADVFDAIEVDAPGEAEYNIVTNNCAVLILGMMKALGIQLSPSDRAQIASGLVAADAVVDHKLAKYVRESGEIERSLGLTQDATNGQLVERLTLRQIALALDAEDAPIDGPSTELLAAVSKPSIRSGHAARSDASPVDEGSGSDAEGDNRRELIVGGKGVTTQEFPFFVQSEERTAATANLPDQPLCGAVLVAPDVILTTAGECYDKFKWSRKVMVGSFLLSNTYGGAEFRDIVSDIIVHPKYKKISTFQDEYTYDFAMMKIEAVTLPNLVPVVLNADESNPQLNQSLTTVGYGRISASGSYAHSPELRKTTLKAGGDCDYAFSESYNSNVSLCALAPKTDACQGDYGGPLLDSNNTLVGLYSLGTTCRAGSPNAFSRISGAIDWIQDTLCRLSDFRGNYTYCPSVVCPADLTLLGEFNASVLGAATLPVVDGNMLSPQQVSVVQSPPAGTLIKPGKSRLVQIVATDANNQTTNCSFWAKVPAIELNSYVPFRAKRSNVGSFLDFSLDVPFAGRYQYVNVEVSFKVERAKDAVISVTFRREDIFNRTDSTFLQSFKVRGNKIFNARFVVTADVAAPDPSLYAYTAYFTTKGITANGDVTYYLSGQVKKQ